MSNGRKKPILDVIQSNDSLKKIELLRENNILLTTAKCSNEKCDFKGIREMAFKKRMQAKSDKPVGDGWWFRYTASKCTTWKSCRVNSFFDMFQLPITTLLTLIYNWTMLLKHSDTIEVTGVAKQTLVTFYQTIRFVVSKAFN
jgi:hypothetical protein